MNKKIQLPIEVQNNLNDILSIAFPICVLLAHKELYEYYLKHYIECYCYLKADGNLNYSLNNIFDYAGNKEEKSNILRQEYYDVDNLKHIFKQKSCITFIKNLIKSDKYVISFMDEYYIPEREETFGKNHFVHEYMIYGYNDFTMRFLVIAFDKNRVFRNFELNYEDVAKAIQQGLIYYLRRNIDWIGNRFVITLQIDFTKFVQKNTESEILMKLKSYYKADEFGINTNDKFTKIYYGIETDIAFVDRIDNLLASDGDVLDFAGDDGGYRMVHAYAQHKQCIQERIKYLVEKKFLDVNNYSNIVIQAEKIRMLCLKIWKLDGHFNVQKKSLIKMKKMFIENHEQEMMTLNNLLK